MKKSLIHLLLFLPLLALAAPRQEILTVAVFDFEAKDEGARDLGQKVSALIAAELSAHPQLITVERAELDKALGEQELGLSGTVSSETAAKVGHLTGAKVLVTGRAFKVEKETMLVAKIISTETSRVFGETTKGTTATSLPDLSSALAKKIAQVIIDKGTNLVASTLSHDERITNLVTALKPGKRPSVSVKISERHFGGPVIDPAAETELQKILQMAGFTVVDEKSSEKPEFEISGEAFSAFGLRKGNLFSCRSRIELKIHEQKNGKLRLSDRQTSVAVDIAEQTAAKTALQNAALDLAPRVLAALTQ